MSERLDRIEALLERTVEQTARTQDEVSDLLGLFRGLLEGFERTQQEIAESNRRFDILRAEAISDRQQSDARFAAMMQRFDRTLNKLDEIDDRVSNLEQSG